MSDKAVGIGFSNANDVYAAGRGAALIAVNDLASKKHSLVLVFASRDTDPIPLVNGIRSVVGETVPVIGGAAIGVITNDQLSYEGFQVGAAIFDASFLEAKVACASYAHGDLKQAGARLVDDIGVDETSRAMLLFFDSLNRNDSTAQLPSIQSSMPIMEGVYDRLKHPVDIYGAGMIGEFDFSSAFVLDGQSAGTQMLAGAALHGAFQAYGTISHGCSPLDGIYRRITKQRGNVIMELDGKPVVEVIDDIYGSRAWREEVPVKDLTIGVNRGARFAVFSEECFVNRLILGALPDDAGIALFEEGPQEGDEIQFLMRDTERMMSSVQEKSKELLARIQKEGKTPQFALYIDCAGRAASFSQTVQEEASFIQSAMSEAGVPLLGFYSGIELAPIQGVSRSLDWTGVLLILAD